MMEAEKEGDAGEDNGGFGGFEDRQEVEEEAGVSDLPANEANADDGIDEENNFGEFEEPDEIGSSSNNTEKEGTATLEPQQSLPDEHAIIDDIADAQTSSDKNPPPLSDAIIIDRSDEKLSSFDGLA